VIRLTKLILLGIILILFINGHALAETKILAPIPNQTVERVVAVDGNTTETGHLWILVGPQKSPDDWWPQKGGPLQVANGNFFESAFLGGEKGDEFQIAVMQANESINAQIIQWMANCNASDYWPPITKEDPVTRVMIPKEVIEDSIEAMVLVKLGE
jgi:hypothetical protein